VPLPAKFSLPKLGIIVFARKRLYWSTVHGFVLVEPRALSLLFSFLTFLLYSTGDLPIMPLAIPPELKKISPFVRRAEELDRDQTSPESRLVAYYLRQYAVHQGIPLASASPGAKTCLGHLLESLEKEKTAMDAFTRNESSFLCRQFANRVFDKADGEDRMGMATKETAKTFYAAASFLQMLEQFYEKDDEESIEARAENRKRIIYTKWKATEILKAIKEGRQPAAGGYGEEEGESEDEEKDEASDEPVASNTNIAEKEWASTGSEKAQAAAFDVLPPAVPIRPPAPLEPEVEPEPMSESESEPEVDQGAEISAESAPPAYPGDSKTNGISIRPPVTFDLPPIAPETPLELPPRPLAPQKKGGMFGLMKQRQPGAKATKAQITDATELARFAVAALEDKDAELAAERLQQALEALGR
jgi:vacuolar protein sorting-associated protein VTA1